jgi:hypothetical protein
MSYNRPINPGVGLKQIPVTIPGIQELTVDSDIATIGSLGVVQVGSGLSISHTGVLSASGGGSLVGNWIPAITSSGAGIIVLSINAAKYNKAGQLVTCTFDIQVASTSGGSSSNTLRLTNLPFTSVVGTGYVGSLYFSYFENMDDNIDYISGSVIQNNTAVDLWYTNQQAKSMVNLNQGTLKAGSKLIGSIEYISAV